ncbi:cell wall-binding repeat-containing protein, partial [Microbacterium sp. B24]|uniref:cell wall-binding repeat-containing protein n=1 Tax=Microbacterium sp. B24 TaxID=95616 RepID=UPI0035B55567
MAVFIVAAAVSSTGVASATGGDPTPFPPGYSRLAGADRYETAVAVSGRYSPGVPVAYVATGANFPDALSAAAVAASDGGPLLLTSPDALPSVVHAELSRLQPASIVVIGGFAAVSPSVERSLEGIAPTSRIAGDDRYATARSVVSSGFATAPTVFLATGASSPMR